MPATRMTMHTLCLSRAALPPTQGLPFITVPSSTPLALKSLQSATKAIPAATAATVAQRASFSSSTPRKQQGAKNRVYSSVRNQDQFSTYLQLSSSSRRPLLTLWTTSYCTTCHQVSPLLKQLIESGVGEAEGGVTYCEVEYDAPDVMTAGLGFTYMINSVPTLLSFDASEAQVETKVSDGNRLKDKHFLEEWIRTEARRHGDRGGGGDGGSLFGGLFGSFKK